MAAHSTNTRQSRSVSQDAPEDSGSDTHQDQPNATSAPGRPGRKKNPDSQAARRDQNRIAQREFRLRKQQRIRDLEARVEILSGSKDETYSELRSMLKDLMEENQVLRNLVRSLSDFIGEGKGGILPKLGFERPQEFVEFINRAETDTVFEGFRRRKQATGAPGQPPTASANSAQKRATDEEEDPRPKRAKTDSGMGTLDITGKESLENGRYASMLLPMSAAATTNGFYSSTGRSPNDIGLFTELLRGQGTGSAMLMGSSISDDSQSYGTPTSAPAAPSFPPPYHPPINVNASSSLPSHSYISNSMAPLGSPSAHVDDDNAPVTIDSKLQEAQRLIHYHLDNYKRNNAYCLPQSLRPTLVQRTVPHESVIDGVPHPELRDRMILQRGRFDIVDCLHNWAKSLTLHGDDVLAHSNWELGESWLRKYGFLVDQSVLNICNRWRRERGEPELSGAEIQTEPLTSQT